MADFHGILAHSSVYNRKSFHVIQERHGTFFLFLDVVPEGAVVQFLEELVEFLLLPHELELNPTVRKVLDPTEHIEAFGELLRGVAKSDPLHSSGEKILPRCHAVS
jgi:hypothetical protein